MKPFWKGARASLYFTVPALLLGLTACGSSADWRKPAAEADKALSERRYDAAEASSRQALSLAEHASDKDNLSAQLQLTRVLLKENKVGEAETRLGTALDFAQRKFGADSPDCLPIYKLMADIYYRTKRFELAEKTSRNALTIAEHVWGKDDTRLEPYIANLVGTACINGRCQDETDLDRRLTTLREKIFGPEDPQTCGARQMLAESLAHKKQYDECIQLYKFNLAAYQKNNRLFVPGTLNHLAAVYDAQGKYAEAEGCLREAIGYERSNPLLHGALTVSLQSMAVHYEKAGKFDDAEKMFKQALDEVLARSGADKLAAADYYQAYARILRKNGKAAEAAKYQREGDALQDALDVHKRQELKNSG